MAESTVQPGKKAATADECGQFNCLDDNDCCKHCGAHFADPHNPGCVHKHEPVDECDTRPADDEPVEEECGHWFEVHVMVRGVDGAAVGRDVLALLERHGFTLHRRVAGVWRRREYGPVEFVCAASLETRGEGDATV